MPLLPRISAEPKLTEIEDADAADWLARPERCSVAVQTLHQQDGHAMTLVIVKSAGVDDDQDEGQEDTYDRFTRFGA